MDTRDRNDSLNENQKLLELSAAANILSLQLHR